MTAATKTRDTVEVGSQELQNAEQAIGHIAMGSVTVLSVVMGAWAVACMIGGMVAAGGPFALARSWISAVIGM